MTTPQPITIRDPYTQGPQELARTLEPLVYGMSARRVYEDFLDICIRLLDDMPMVFNALARGEKPVDPPAVQAQWKRWREDYKEHGIDRMARGFAILMACTEAAEGEPSYADVLGPTFELLGMGDRQSQFFTPWAVAQMIAQMQLSPDAIRNEMRTRLVAAVDQTAEYQMAGFLGVELSLKALISIAQLHNIAVEPYAVCDPACGSGIMLLAGASCCPRELIDANLIQFYGTDIDAMCVKMAQLNMRLYSLNGYRYEIQGLQTEATQIAPVALLPAPDPGREMPVANVTLKQMSLF
ncbi:MAG: N-6 DNA methylase [Anaerolineae bacterium]